MRRSKKAVVKNSLATFDRKLFIIALILTLVGLLSVADASAPLAVRNFSDQYFFVKQQAVWALVGVVSMVIFSRINYKLWEKVANYLFFFSLLGLVLVFIPGFGIKVLGASRWVRLGFLSFQPSEIIKLSLAIYLAKVYSKGKGLVSYIFPAILVSGLIMFQPDLGTTAIIVGFSMFQIFASGINLFKLAGMGVLGALGMVVLTLTSGYRRERLMTFLYETKNPLDEGYHIRQILLALGSGGLMGVGLGQSRQKYLFLPETATDSIFAVIAEEIGFLGASVLIILFILFISRGLWIAKRAPDKFSFLLSVGITSWIGVQIFLNIASMVALLPLTGIPLPFISFGGTSLVSVLIGTGILLNISRYAKN